MRRLGLRDAFLRLERQPRPFFYTTSQDKFAQAQLAFQRSGLSVTEFKSRDEPYRENESGTSAELLQRAIDEICQTVPTAPASLFFVEDTSLRIDALSSTAREFPGLWVKQWFAGTSFEELDAELRKNGNNRKATVKSDIALHVPNLALPAYFHGETHGCVADAPPSFSANKEHPWLRPDTFNGWFVPDGAERPLGAMTLEESWRYDFRARALMQLLDRIEEYAAILNLPSRASVRRARGVRLAGPSLFTINRPALLVIGPTCAGKTTFGDKAAREGTTGERVIHIEASEVVRTFNGGPREGETAFDFALRVLGQHGPDVAARRIVDEYYGSELEGGFVITGFRTIEELLYLKSKFPETRVLYIDAPAKTRYDRYLQRRRSADALTLDEFKLLDEAQASFGLLSVGQQLAELYLRNDQNIDAYHQQIDAIVLGTPAGDIPGFGATPDRHETSRGQLFRCLEALEKAGRPLSTDEIETFTSESGARILHNNANKTLKRYPALARRLEGGSGRLRYDLTPAGRAYVTYVKEHVHRGGDRSGGEKAAQNGGRDTALMQSPSSSALQRRDAASRSGKS